MRRGLSDEDKSILAYMTQIDSQPHHGCCGNVESNITPYQYCVPLSRLWLRGLVGQARADYMPDWLAPHGKRTWT
jgi:hypothetical protein